MRATLIFFLIAQASCCWAKLPAPTEAAKAAWTEKVSLYKTCLAMDRAVDAYRRNLKSVGKGVPAPTPTPPCADPGSYAAPVTPTTSKPLEASEAHSPPGTATSPPSNKATSAEMTGTRK